MDIILSFIQLVTILFICIYEYKRKYISVFMWATLLVMFGIPHFISVITGISLYDNTVLYKASFFVITFNLIYFLTKIITESVMIKRQNQLGISAKAEYKELPELGSAFHRDKIMMNISFILLLTSLLVVLWVSRKYFGGIANSSWGNFYMLNQEMGFSNPVKYAEFIFFAVAGIVLVFKNYGKKNFFFISFVIIICYSIITGNRITILPAFMAIIIPVAFNAKKKLSIRKTLYFSFMALIVIYSIYMLRIVRIVGGISNFFENFNLSVFNNMILNMLLNGEGELGLRKAFYYFIENDNNFSGFNQGATYIRLLLIAIPTKFVDGIKPPDFAITMGSAYIGDAGNTTYSMHPTLYGDAFANFWWYGILLGAFWAIFTYFICLFVNRKNQIVRSMLLVLFGAVFVIAGRGSVYNGFYLGFEGSIIIGLIYLITRFKIR